MNSTEIKHYSPIEKPKDKIIVSYFGGLHLNRWEMIARIARLMPRNSIVNVYTFSEITDDIKDAFDKNNVFIHKGISGEELNNQMSNSHILLHVESDDEYYTSLTKLSISTKIPEYLMHGRLILGFGPMQVASLRFLEDNKIGYVISSKNSEAEIQNSLKTIFEDKLLFETMGRAAYNYAVSHFNKTENSTRFYKQLLRLTIKNHKSCQFSKTKS